MQSRTILEWLETIEDKDIRQKAISNYHYCYKTDGTNDGSLTYQSLEFAIGAAFIWNETPEGHQFWSDFYFKL